MTRYRIVKKDCIIDKYKRYELQKRSCWGWLDVTATSALTDGEAIEKLNDFLHPRLPNINVIKEWEE